MDLEQAKSYIVDNKVTKRADLLIATAMLVPESDGSDFFGITKTGCIAYGKSKHDYRLVDDKRLIEIVELVQ